MGVKMYPKMGIFAVFTYIFSKEKYEKSVKFFEALNSACDEMKNIFVKLLIAKVERVKVW